MEKPWKERPVFPGRKTRHRNIFDERGVSPVIAVILMVAITVVLAAVLYAMLTILVKPPVITPRGTLTFEEDWDNPGKYKGEFEGSVELGEIEISVYDASKEDTIILKPTEETYNEIPGGLSITFKDTNENNKLDVVDMILIQGAEPGDQVRIAHVPSGGTVASKILN